MTGTRHIRFEETGRNATYVMQYSSDEMREVFSAIERKALALGEVVRHGSSNVVDLEAHFLRVQG